MSGRRPYPALSDTRSDSDPILIRCDGTVETGLGHVSRCLALAEALQECGLACRFLGRFDAGATALLSSAGLPFESLSEQSGTDKDALATIHAGKQCQAAGMVVDSYAVQDDYVSTLGRAVPVLLIDDFKRLTRYDCTAVLNFTINAPLLPYPRGAQRYLLGPEYLLVRKSLRELRRSGTPCSRNVGRVLVAMGGADTADLTSRVVRALLKVAPNLSVLVVVGKDYGRGRELSSLMAGFSGKGEVMVQLRDMAEAFRWADMCVCGGGLTKYEAAYIGRPAAVLSQTREVFEETRHFVRRGLAFDLGLGEMQDDAGLAGLLADFIADAELRDSLCKAGIACIPEDSTQRAAETLVEVVRGRANGVTGW